jgi:hypothetical protein
VLRGSVTSACGRAIATIISVSADQEQDGGTWRRNRWPMPIASLTIARLA